MCLSLWSGIGVVTSQAGQKSSESTGSVPNPFKPTPDEMETQAFLRRLTRRPVEIFLHRGENPYAPASTLPAAFENALRFGVDYLEFDVRANFGGVFSLHDYCLDHITDGTVPIQEKTGVEMLELSGQSKFGSDFANVRVPCLDESLEAFAPRIGLYFDAKGPLPITPMTLSDALDLSPQRPNVPFGSSIIRKNTIGFCLTHTNHPITVGPQSLAGLRET